MRIRIATRGSELALWQARHVRARLEQTEPSVEVDINVIKTKGDEIKDIPLWKVGGKGLFVKEIEEALVEKRADVAVHSMKDVPAALAPGCTMAAISERADPRDALCAKRGGSFGELPKGARIGTSSLRRVTQLRAARPDLDFVMLRGNVPTRIQKLDAGEFDAVILAVAGLERLGLADRITEKLAPEICLPACGQGALGIETRATDRDLAALVQKALQHEEDAVCVRAERAFLEELGGGCQLPVAGYAILESGLTLFLRGLIGDADGKKLIRGERRAGRENAEAAGVDLARDLLDRGGRDILTSLPKV
jgi:hydroxymethylbilane synthase